MGYYQRGDMYSGGYPRGDFFGGLVGGITGAVKGFATGGITGAVTGAISGANTGSRGPGGAPPRPPGTGISFPAGGGIATPFGNFGTLKPGTAAYDAANRPPSGYHISKTTGKLVKNRHMNPLNVKALRRADRRARSFLHITRSVVRHYVSKQPKGRSYVHATKKRSR